MPIRVIEDQSCALANVQNRNGATKRKTEEVFYLAKV